MGVKAIWRVEELVTWVSVEVLVNGFWVRGSWPLPHGVTHGQALKHVFDTRARLTPLRHPLLCNLFEVQRGRVDLRVDAWLGDVESIAVRARAQSHDYMLAWSHPGGWQCDYDERGRRPRGIQAKATEGCAGCSKQCLGYGRPAREITGRDAVSRCGEGEALNFACLWSERDFSRLEALQESTRDAASVKLHAGIQSSPCSKNNTSVGGRARAGPNAAQSSG